MKKFSYVDLVYTPFHQLGVNFSKKASTLILSSSRTLIPPTREIDRGLPQLVHLNVVYKFFTTHNVADFVTAPRIKYEDNPLKKI